ncbi:DUF2281 domain-containing protein [Alkalinema sp. FACHB-956]|uniref:DUF2281 domain-containing protein n=1 Tax=Alkalinema sp. FACHB-956 TaxID=2692768 RepID=UPI001683799D|nr:DUF2281 domain-containing protein [Alkalinema sp. FACHB-956]MBD2328501.1 DUF2281 domain-containing protein [Alkalinema sp. FACHB-956]
MTAAEKLYALIKVLPDDQVSEVLDFAEFLHQKQLSQASSSQSSSSVPKVAPGTLTGLLGIAKRAGQTLSDEELQADYTDYLTEKYQ